MINRIRDIRKQKGMTLAEVAAACDPPTTAQTIGRLETGMRNLSLIWMNKIAAALGVDPELLVKGETTEEPKVLARLTESGAEALPSPRDAILPVELGGEAPLVCLAVETPQGEYRAGDQLWMRQLAPEEAPKLINRDVLVPRTGGRFAFGRTVRVRAADRPSGHDGRAAAARDRPAADRRRQPGLAGRCGDAGSQAVKRVLSIATLYPNAHQPRFGTFVARQMEALATRGDWDVTVINPIGAPPLAPGRYKPLVAAAVTGVEHGVTVHRPRFMLVPAVGGPFNPRMIVRAVLPLAQRLHALAPFDLVDAQFFYPDGPAAARIAHELRLPLSIKARGADISHWGGKAYALRKMLHAAQQAAGLLAVSAALADCMTGLGFPRGKITVHYTGLDHSRFHPLGRKRSRARLREAFGISLPDDAPLLATVGALIERKGQRFVLRALARLPSAHLALVGAGPDRTGLEAFVREAGMADRVHFLGSLDHLTLPSVLSAADAMVLPSESEGLANAWVEALACGCPLVISDAGGAREVVTAPEAGRIVARDAEAIADAVRELLAGPPAREAVAECAARFSWEANAAALAGYYEGLVAE